MNAIVSALLLAIFVGIALSILNALGIDIDLDSLVKTTQNCVEVVYASGVVETICQ